MAEQTVRRSRPDAGFTLIEVVIVVMMIGIVTAAVATSITVVLRNAPPTEVRADDARSVQGLVTWLPQDVDAAPPGGFNRAHGYWPCAGSAPADSHNVLTAEWTESTGVDHDFAATYRYEQSGGEWSMVRYTCDDGGGGAMSAGERQNLTSALPEWGSPAPARVVMCSSSINAGGTCPAANVIPEAIANPPEVRALQLLITRLDGVEVTIDAAPKNPDQDLADDPDATTTNLKPTLAQINYVLQMHAGDTTTIDILTTHGAADPEGDPISAALDSTEPLPPGITAATSDPMFLEVTADPSLSPGVLSPKLILIVSDNNAGWVDATVTIEILHEPNVAPTVSPSTYALDLEPGETVTLPIDTTHNVFDGNGDALTMSVTGYPVLFTLPPTVGSPDPLDLTITALPLALPGPAGSPITLQISDGNGGTVTATVTITIVAPTANQAPTATTTDVAETIAPGDTLSMSLDTSHGVSDPDGDPLSITAVSGPAGITTTLDGGLGLTIEADASLLEGPVSPAVSLTVEDPNGDSVTVTVTLTVVAPPPPPSDCVLGSLTTSQASADRQGNGGQPHPLKPTVTVTLTYSGTCNGLTLQYDTGDHTGLGVSGRVFPPGSPTSVPLVGKDGGGTEKWLPGIFTLTAVTTSDVTPNSISTTLTVN